MVRRLFVGFALSVAIASVAIACGNDAVSPPLFSARADTKPVAPDPEPEPQSDEELPGLDPQLVIEIVNDHQSAVTGCHVVGFSGNGAHSGSVTIAWFISPNGTVRDARIAESSFEDESFHQCIISIISELEFPSAPGSTEVGGWRFRFRSRGH